MSFTGKVDTPMLRSSIKLIALLLLFSLGIGSVGKAASFDTTYFWTIFKGATKKYAFLKTKNSHDSLKSKIDLELKNGTKVAFRSIEDAMSNCRDFILNTTINLYKNGHDVGNLISKYYN